MYVRFDVYVYSDVFRCVVVYVIGVNDVGGCVEHTCEAIVGCFLHGDERKHVLDKVLPWPRDC